MLFLILVRAYDSESKSFVFAFGKNYVEDFVDERIYALVSNMNNQEAQITVQTPYLNYGTKRYSVAAKENIEVKCVTFVLY